MRFQRKKHGKTQSGFLGEITSKKLNPETHFHSFQVEKTSIRDFSCSSKKNEILHDLSNLSHSIGLKLFLLEKSMKNGFVTLLQRKSLDRIKTTYEDLLIALEEFKKEEFKKEEFKKDGLKKDGQGDDSNAF